MSTFQIVLLSVAAWIYIYSIVDRICKCAEHRANARLLDSHLSDPEALNKFIQQFNKQ